MLKITGKVSGKRILRGGTIMSEIGFPQVTDIKDVEITQTIFVPMNLELGQIVTITIDAGIEENF